MKKPPSKGSALLDKMEDTYRSKKDKRTYSKIRKKGYKSNELRGRAYKVRPPSK